ncbi:MAG: flagellar basal body-associated FliL family protein [SAR324 cluster bacterium]|nr:flagellar basal body-associated FliL family protein [SAR324 cluster bacterium]
MAQSPANQQPDAPATEATPKGGGDLLRKLMIAFIVILILIGIAGAGYYLFFSGSDNLTMTDEDDNIMKAPPVFMAAMPYQISLSDGRRFLAVNVRLEVLDLATSGFINSRLPIVNDIVISTLQRYTSKELRKASGVEQLKRDIKRRLNSGKLFNEDFISLKDTTTPIHAVYFDKFILQ